MTYYILPEEDYLGDNFVIEAREIKSNCIINAIQLYLQDYCKMYDDGDYVNLFVSVEDKIGKNLLKYRAGCVIYKNYEIEEIQ